MDILVVNDFGNKTPAFGKNGYDVYSPGKWSLNTDDPIQSLFLAPDEPSEHVMQVDIGRLSLH